MDFEGKLIQFIGETSGTSKTGKPWKKKEWVLETFGPYPRKVKVQCFGDRADSIIMEPGKDYRLSVDLESREFGGRWYTDVSVFRVVPFTGAQDAAFGGQGGNGYGQPYGQPSHTSMPGNAPYGGDQYGDSQSSFAPADDNGEDLPF